MLAPINAYLGSALIIIALGMALVGLSGGHMGGLVARLIQIEGHLAALRKGMENGPAAPAASTPPAKKAKAKAKAKAKSPKAKQAKRRG